MPIIICPNCKLLLHQIGNTLRCQNGHLFDIARQGYVNLLLANQKKNSNPGDNKIMINARDAFLSKGYFDFLIDNIESMVNSSDCFSEPNTKSVHLLDLGCGTGYYTSTLFKDKDINRVGVDISKTGITKAAVRDKASTYIVGSAFDLPIDNDAVDLIVNIFSPMHLEEAKRVLKHGGYFIKVVPAGDHMKEIAELVYEKLIPHQSYFKEEIESDSNFSIVSVDTLKRIIDFPEGDLRDFITMTPYLYKFKKGQLESLKNMSVTTSFEIIIGQYMSSNP